MEPYILFNYCNLILLALAGGTCSWHHRGIYKLKLVIHTRKVAMGVNFAANLAHTQTLPLKWRGNIDDVFKRFYALARLYNQLRLGVSVVATSYHGAASRIIKAHCVRFLFKVVKNCGFNIAHYRQVMHTGLQVLA